MLYTTGNMYLLGIISFAIFVTVSGNVVPKDDEDLPDLKWPKKYTFQAEKLTLTSDLVEDVAYWRTSKKSRVDYNEGAVKSFTMKSKKGTFRYGINYKIHPESSEEEKNKLVCIRTNGTIFSRIYLEKVLPDEDLFDLIDCEIVCGLESDIGYILSRNNTQFFWDRMKT